MTSPMSDAEIEKELTRLTGLVREMQELVEECCPKGKKTARGGKKPTIMNPREEPSEEERELELARERSIQTARKEAVLREERERLQFEQYVNAYGRSSELLDGIIKDLQYGVSHARTAEVNEDQNKKNRKIRVAFIEFNQQETPSEVTNALLVYAASAFDAFGKEKFQKKRIKDNEALVEFEPDIIVVIDGGAFAGMWSGKSRELFNQVYPSATEIARRNGSDVITIFPKNGVHEEEWTPLFSIENYGILFMPSVITEDEGLEYLYVQGMEADALYTAMVKKGDRPIFQDLENLEKVTKDLLSLYIRPFIDAFTFKVGASLEEKGKEEEEEEENLDFGAKFSPSRQLMDDYLDF